VGNNFGGDVFEFGAPPGGGGAQMQLEGLRRVIDPKGREHRNRLIIRSSDPSRYRRALHTNSGP
jgi:hypothetical protein